MVSKIQICQQLIPMSFQNSLDPFGDFGVNFQLRGMVRLFPGVYHQRTAATPVLVLGDGLYPEYIVAGVGAGEGYPNKIIERGCRKTTVVGQNNERNTL